jgi:uncharacterized protein YcfJ
MKRRDGFNPASTVPNFSVILLECPSQSATHGFNVITPMKTIVTIIFSAASVIALSNCAAPTGPNTQRGAATGGLLGAAAGGIIGHQSGNALEGALIGGAAGAGAGALYGNARDQEQYGGRRY